MKQNELKDKDIIKLAAQQLENLFHVYETDNGMYFYNISRTVNFPEDLDPSLFTQYVTINKDTWPLISWKHYNDVQLWWLVCSVNNIINPVVQPTTGLVLKILRPEVVREVLSEIKGA